MKLFRGVLFRALLCVLCVNASAGAQEMSVAQKVELGTAIGRFLVVLASHAQAHQYKNAAPALTITSDLLRVANDVLAGKNHGVSFASGAVATMDVISLLTDVWDALPADDDSVVEVTTEKKEILFISNDDTQKRIPDDKKDKKENKTKTVEIVKPVVQETIVTKVPEIKNETRALTEHETQLLATYLAPLIEAAAAVGISLSNGNDEQSKAMLTTLQWLVLFARFYPEFFQKNLRVATTKILFSLVVGGLLSQLVKEPAAPDTKGVPVRKDASGVGSENRRKPQSWISDKELRGLGLERKISKGNKVKVRPI